MRLAVGSFVCAKMMLPDELNGHAETCRRKMAERKQREADESAGLALYHMAGELLGPELVKLSEHGNVGLVAGQ